jgi:hypothetical protein
VKSSTVNPPALDDRSVPSLDQSSAGIASPGGPRPVRRI